VNGSKWAVAKGRVKYGEAVVVRRMVLRGDEKLEDDK
jgi:hypothetical protein